MDSPAYESGSAVAVEATAIARGLVGALDLAGRGIDNAVFGSEMSRATAWVLDNADASTEDRLTLLLASICRITVLMGDILDRESRAGGLSAVLTKLEEMGASVSLHRGPLNP